jgi:hypothetical protein
VSTGTLILQASVFSGAALAVVLSTAWWLFRSPLRRPVKALGNPSPAMAALVAGLLGFAGLAQFYGAYWDASMHRKTGLVPAGADFLWPPHLLIYSGFLAMLVVAVITLAAAALPFLRNGVKDPRHWVRANPYLGAVVIASLYGLGSIPGDAIWHAVFGIDLTAWSPPHVLIFGAAIATIICAAALLAQAGLQVRLPGALSLADLGSATLLALTLCMGQVLAVAEWEYGALVIRFRPAWLYPVVGGLAGLLVLGLARRLVRFRFAATTTALLFHLFRAAAVFLPMLTGDPGPRGPLIFLGAGLLFDLVPVRRLKGFIWQDAALAAAYAVGFTLPNWPWLTGNWAIPTITWPHLGITLALLILPGMLILPFTRWAAGVLGKAPAKGEPAPAGFTPDGVRA